MQQMSHALETKTDKNIALCDEVRDAEALFVGDMQTHTLFDRLQLFPWLEPNRLAGRNIDFGPRTRIAPNARLSRTHGEHPKAPQFDAVTLREGGFHAVKDRLHCHLGLGLGYPSLGHNFVNQIQFDHKWLRNVLSPGTA